ncbi:MAG: peptide-methionine (R)-S-oxide reductase MsrB [Mariprofundus sp.]|nr:peptide-methionine (R)-S-oxide reductase MsrB [Mariprofundus sp.]
MKRRTFLQATLAAAALLSAPRLLQAETQRKADMTDTTMEKITKSDSQWRQILSSEQYDVLRNEGTERPFTSPLNKQYDAGTYVCAGCALPLFEANTKFDSGTGWPSFYQSIEGHTETKLDFKMILPRKEYHCMRCGGHQGHIFNDGPEPTGQRWCNNGVALKFIPAV